MTEPLLTVKNLNVFFHRKQGDQQLLKEIDLVIPKGQVVGIVGESGSGKSMTMKSVMGSYQKISPTPLTRLFLKANQLLIAANYR